MKRKTTKAPETIEARKARIASAWKPCTPTEAPALRLVWKEAKAGSVKPRKASPAPVDVIPVFVNASVDRSFDVERVNSYFHAKREKEYTAFFAFLEMEEEASKAESKPDEVTARIEAIKARIEKAREARKGKPAPAPVDPSPVTEEEKEAYTARKGKREAMPAPAPSDTLTPRPLTEEEKEAYTAPARFEMPAPYATEMPAPVDVFEEYENAVRKAYFATLDPSKVGEDSEVGKAIFDLAPVPVFAVLKTLCNVGGCSEKKHKENKETGGYIPRKLDGSDGTKVPRKLRSGIASDLVVMRSDYMPAPALATIPDPTDPNKSHKVDPSPAPSLPLSDGSDLFQRACLEIWQGTLAMLTDRPEEVNGHFLTASYTVKALNKKVWIKEDTAPALVTRETSILKNAVVGVRREIESKRGIRFNEKYVYIKRSFGDFSDYVYMRVDRLTARLAGSDTPSKKKVDRIDGLLEALNLTARQAEILKYRLLGFGKKAIATRLDIDPSTVKEHVQAMQKKARKLAEARPDLLPASLLEKMNIA